MLRVANAEPKRVDLGDDALEPDDTARRAFGLLVLGDAGNLDYDRELTGMFRLTVEQRYARLTVIPLPPRKTSARPESLSLGRPVFLWK